jgi:flagellar biosynthesis chaperone FliJ
LDVIPAVQQSVSYLGATGADTVDELATIDAAAEPIVVEARSAFDAQQWLTAIDEFSTVLETYPRSRYRQEAVAGIRNAAQNLSGTAETQADNLNAQIVALEESLANARSDLASLEAEQVEIAQEEQNQVRALETELAEQRSALETTEATLADTRRQLNETREELSIAQAALAQVDTATNAGTSSPPPEDLVALRDAQAAFDSYQSSAPTGDSTVDLLNARVSLERFLGMAVMDRLFPGLAQEVGRFDQAYLSSGRENALIDAADLLSDLSAALSDAERERILSSAGGRMTADDSRVTDAADEFVFQLSDLLESVR